MFSVPFRCKRSTVIQKHISEVNRFLGDLTQWPRWSPWLCLDKETLFDTKGQPGEEGHEQSWEGERLGAGRVTLLRKSTRELYFELEIVRPWQSKAQVCFLLEGHGGQTTVLWQVLGRHPLGKFFSRKLLLALLANDCDRGLLMLKDLMESGSMISDTRFLGLKKSDGFHYVGIRQNGDLTEMSTKMSKSFEELTAKVEAGLLPTPKYYLAFFHRYDLAAMRCDYTCALAYDKLPEGKFGLTVEKLENHQALRVLHTGAYKYLGNAWSAVMLEQRRLGLKSEKRIPQYELYLNNPLHFIPEDLQTEISIPVNV